MKHEKGIHGKPLGQFSIFHVEHMIKPDIKEKQSILQLIVFNLTPCNCMFGYFDK